MSAPAPVVDLVRPLTALVLVLEPTHRRAGRHARTGQRTVRRRGPFHHPDPAVRGRCPPLARRTSGAVAPLRTLQVGDAAPRGSTDPWLASDVVTRPRISTLRSPVAALVSLVAVATLAAACAGVDQTSEVSAGAQSPPRERTETPPDSRDGLDWSGCDLELARDGTARVRHPAGPARPGRARRHHHRPGRRTHRIDRLARRADRFAGDQPRWARRFRDRVPGLGRAGLPRVVDRPVRPGLLRPAGCRSEHPGAVPRRRDEGRAAVGRPVARHPRRDPSAPSRTRPSCSTAASRTPLVWSST